MISCIVSQVKGHNNDPFLLLLCICLKVVEIIDNCIFLYSLMLKQCTVNRNIGFCPLEEKVLYEILYEGKSIVSDAIKITQVHNEPG